MRNSVKELKQQGNLITVYSMLAYQVNALDYEIESSYRLLIVAADGGIPSKTANVSVQIDVLDANDHIPKFISPSSSATSISIPEDIPVLAKILKVNATDRDGGKNGQISYVLKEIDKTEQFFGIHGKWVLVIHFCCRIKRYIEDTTELRRKIYE